MPIVSFRRARRYVIPPLAVLGVVAVPTAASAEVERFRRFEEVATANWVVTNNCADGSEAQTRVTVIAGLERQSPDLSVVNRFGTVLIQGFDCDGNLINDRGSGPASYSRAPSLIRASATGSVPMRSGASAAFDVRWESTSPFERNVNRTRFPGFVGVFTSERRDAVATGTVVVDGATLVNGSTDNAEIETLEDRNRTRVTTPPEG